jgi:2,4-dienoyl-CoA reductase (NADPH2)
MAVNTKFKNLMEPGFIGKVQTKNRLFKTGASSTLGDASGKINDRHRAFYGAIARGGIGLIVVEGCSLIKPPVMDISSGANTTLRLDNDEFIPSLKGLTNLIHKYDCPVFIQMMLGGPSESAPGVPPVAPSFLTAEELRELQPYHKLYLTRSSHSTHELNIGEIEEIQEKWFQAAERAAQAGFNGIELNGGNSHMLNSFHSRIWNRRQDKYGCQNLENRTRFTIELLQGIKKRLGKNFPVTVALNIAEYGMENATTLEEGVGMAKIIAQAGADAIWARTHGYKDVSIDIIWPERVFIPEPPNPLPKEMDWSRLGAGSHVPLAAAVKKVVSVPVLVAGRFYPELAEKVIEDGEADFIGMTRRLQADPELPNKVASGKLDDIAPCTACSHCLESNSFRRPIVCRINAALGGEKDYSIIPAEKKKKVVVVGGGPAAMETARVASIRGHDVWLYEKENRLGGIMPLAAMVKGTEIEDLPGMVRYLDLQVRKLGVKINLGKKFDPSMLDQIKPDVVVLATGGLPQVPNIPGINRRNVVSGGSLHRQLKLLLRFLSPKMLRDLTKIWMPLGNKVVIIGGAIQGLELAEFLVKRGRKVTVVDTAQELGELMPVRNKIKLLKWLPEKGVILITSAKYIEVTNKGLVIENKEGQRQILEADTIATALPLKPDTEMLEAIKGKVSQVFSVGDCKEPRLILHAIADGYRVGSAI